MRAQAERPADLGQQDVAVKPNGRIGSGSKSVLRGSWIVEIPERIDELLVSSVIGAQSGRKTKTSTMISAKSAVRYVIE